MENKIIKEAVEEFKKEQRTRKIKDIKDGFKRTVNCLIRIVEMEERVEEIFKDLGFKLTPEFRKFLSSVEKYEDLVFSIDTNGNIGIGISTSASISSSISTSDSCFVLDSDSGEVVSASI